MKCDGCGAFHLLWNHCPGMLGMELGDLESWMSEHLECNPFFYDVVLYKTPGFSLATESMIGPDDNFINKLNAMPPKDE